MRRTAPTARPITVAILNRHPIERESLAALLRGRTEIEVVAEVENVAGLIALPADPPPGVALLALETGPAGLADVERIAHLAAAPSVVALRRRYSRPLVKAAFRAGARACVSTRAEPAHLVGALVAAAAGETYVCPMVAPLLLGPPPAPEAARDEHRLTRREGEVLALIAQGRTDREIAVVLELRVGTVHTHRKNLMAKLGVHNATTLLRRALALGLVEP